MSLVAGLLPSVVRQVLLMEDVKWSVTVKINNPLPNREGRKTLTGFPEEETITYVLPQCWLWALCWEGYGQSCCKSTCGCCKHRPGATLQCWPGCWLERCSWWCTCDPRSLWMWRDLWDVYLTKCDTQAKILETYQTCSCTRCHSWWWYCFHQTFGSIEDSCFCPSPPSLPIQGDLVVLCAWKKLNRWRH